jgi:hypothetical protein
MSSLSTSSSPSIPATSAAVAEEKSSAAALASQVPSSNINNNKKSQSLEGSLKQLLLEGGVTIDDGRDVDGVPSSTSTSSSSIDESTSLLPLLDRLEAWVGLPSSTTSQNDTHFDFNILTDTMTMEDDAPFS